MPDDHRPLAVVTGASSGIGFELASICATKGFDLVIAADEARIHQAARELLHGGGQVTVVDTDLATIAGVNKLYEAVCGIGRPVDALLANAGHGLGGAFLDQDFDAARHVIDTNITGTVYLIHRIGNDMCRRGEGRILITGSIAGYMPGSFQAIYSATKAFIDSFAAALANELKENGITVTCLMPGPTDTQFFRRAGMLDTAVGSSRKDDPRDVAHDGFAAMMSGGTGVVSGWKNKIEAALANITPAARLAEKHRKIAKPGSARH